MNTNADCRIKVITVIIFTSGTGRSTTEDFHCRWNSTCHLFLNTYLSSGPIILTPPTLETTVVNVNMPLKRQGAFICTSAGEHLGIARVQIKQRWAEQTHSSIKSWVQLGDRMSINYSAAFHSCIIELEQLTKGEKLQVVLWACVCLFWRTALLSASLVTQLRFRKTQRYLQASLHFAHCPPCRWCERVLVLNRGWHSVPDCWQTDSSRR